MSCSQIAAEGRVGVPGRRPTDLFDDLRILFDNWAGLFGVRHAWLACRVLVCPTSGSGGQQRGRGVEQGVGDVE